MLGSHSLISKERMIMISVYAIPARLTLASVVSIADNYISFVTLARIGSIEIDADLFTLIQL